MNLLKRVAAVAVASATALTLSSAPAEAELRTFKDGTKAGQDVKALTVEFGKGTLQITTNVGKIKAGDVYSAWVDTDSSDSGPEYKAEMMPNSDYLGLWRVGSFSDKGKVISYSKCRNFRGYADIFGSTGTSPTFKIPRSCIGNPTSVRVSFRAKFNDRRAGTDWVPGGKKLTPWVNHN